MRDCIGRIAPGYEADIVFLDLCPINWIPINDPTNQLMQIEDGTSVHSTMAGGDLKVRERKLTNMLLASLAKDVEAARARLEAVNRERKSTLPAPGQSGRFLLPWDGP